MNLVKRGKLFTTEPYLNRALAAEMRFDPDATQRFVKDVLPAKTKTGKLESVTCERSDHGKVDVLLEFAKLTVGVECKVDHGLSEAQWEAELATVDYLVVVAKAKADVPESAVKSGALRYTWKKLLRWFTDPRLSTDDVNQLTDLKRVGRRQLNALDVEALVPDSWSVEVAEGGGYPAVNVESPPLASWSGRVVVVQTQIERGGDQYVVNFGLSVGPDDFVTSKTEPEWIAGVRWLCMEVEKELGEEASLLSPNPGTGRKSKDGSPTPSSIKIQLARKFELPLRFAQGYTDYYVGTRTVRVSASDLPATVETVLAAVVRVVERSQKA